MAGAYSFPRDWTAEKRLAAVFTYGITACDNCGKIVQTGDWVFKEDGETLVCEACFDRHHPNGRTRKGKRK